MNRILYSAASPYSAKVLMAATHAGVPFEAVLVDTNAEPAFLMDANPLGKIPVFIDAGADVAVFDSRAITQHINRLSGGGAVFPKASSPGSTSASARRTTAPPSPKTAAALWRPCCPVRASSRCIRCTARMRSP